MIADKFDLTLDKRLIECPKNTIDKVIAVDNSYANNMKGVKASVNCWKFILKDKLKPKEKRELNGCGTKESEAIPDTMWGLCVTPICDIHDYGCIKTTKEGNLEKRRLHDLLFFINLISYINHNSNFAMRSLRRRRALKYYEAVYEIGSKTLWENLKNFFFNALKKKLMK